jgi:signal transduction histidine kinase
MRARRTPTRYDFAMNHGSDMEFAVTGGVGQDARDRDARRYVTRIRPLICVFALTGALLDLSFAPHAVAVPELTGVAVMIASQLLVMAAVVAGVLQPHRAIFFAIAGDIVAITAMTVQYPAPELSACVFALVVPLLSYFTSARNTLITCVVGAALLSVGGPQLSGWDDPTVIPACAFTLLGTGFMSAFVCSRMRATEHALEARAAAERVARERLELVDRSRERLITNVSHELRTPLTVTIGSIDTLLRSEIALDDAKRGQLLELARKGGLRLLSLVEDLLTLGVTRPDSLRLALDPEPLERLVGDAVAGIDPGSDRSIVVTAMNSAPVAVDRMRMMQVIANLVTNGLRHGAGDVIVATDVSDTHATICVCDNGPGVPPEHLDELFLPFARFSTRADSTGLGLAISRTIVEAHGGSIRYARTFDELTTFTVRLPLEMATAPVG